MTPGASDRIMVRLDSIELRHAEQAGIAGSVPAAVTGGSLLVTCDASRYDLASLYRYAKLDPGVSERVFSAFTFEKTPPGLRVGPWPGWRGIPELPIAALHYGERRSQGRWIFWGDELRSRVLRVVFRVESPLGDTGEMIEIESSISPFSAEFHPHEFPVVSPIPAPLSPGLAGEHPRLLFSRRDLDPLRAAASSGSDSWRRLEHALSFPLGLVPTAEAKIPSDNERLSAEDALFLYAFGALMTEDESLIGSALAQFEKSLLDSGDLEAQPYSIDTQCGEALFLLSAAYDMLQHRLDERGRKRARKIIGTVAEHCARFLVPERTDYAQAHYLGCGLGLLAHSIVFDETDQRCGLRRAELRGAFAQVMRMLPSDGFYPHGINLWIYEHGFLLRWAELFHRCCGVDFWSATDYWPAASSFRASVTDSKGLTGVTFGDPQFRTGGDAWQHDLIAARTDDAPAAATPAFLRDQPVSGVDYRCAPARRRIYEFLYSHAESVPEKEAGIVLNFADGGQIVVRDKRTLITIRSGAPVGRRRRGAGEFGGYGHSDPCNGALVLEREGELLLSGPGRVYRRDSSLHNVFTVNGMGQVGDSCVWAPDFMPDVFIPEEPVCETAGACIAVKMETGNAYLPELGVRRCSRAMLTDPRRGILAVDRMLLERPELIEWNLHTQGDFINESFVPVPRFLLRRGEVRAYLAVLPGGPFKWTISESQYVPAYPNDGSADRHLRLSGAGKSMTVVWRLDFDGQEPLEVVPDREGRLRLSAFGGGEAIYDITEHRFLTGRSSTSGDAASASTSIGQ